MFIISNQKKKKLELISYEIDRIKTQLWTAVVFVDICDLFMRAESVFDCRSADKAKAVSISCALPFSLSK